MFISWTAVDVADIAGEIRRFCGPAPQIANNLRRAAAPEKP